MQVNPVVGPVASWLADRKQGRFGQAAHGLRQESAVVAGVKAAQRLLNH